MPSGRTKKEKKSVQVVAVVTPDGIEGTFTPEPRKPLIVHLPFQSSDIEFSSVVDMRYDPNIPCAPEPYDEDQTAYFQVNTEVSSKEDAIGVEQQGWQITNETGTTNNVVPVAGTSVYKQVSSEEDLSKKESKPPITQNTIGINQTSKLLIAYQTKPGETLKIPAKTEIACFWCTDSFEGSPCFIPVKEENNVYHVYGNFCTPQCALAHLLQEHVDSHVRWERMALLHRMYKASGKLYPSPPRESLQKFGGPYNREQFLSILDGQKVRVDIQIPPVVSITGTLDTKPIDFYDSSLQNTFTGGFSLDRFKAWSEQGGALRLKRSKPLKDRESTLDACIQISVRRAGETSVRLD